MPTVGDVVAGKYRLEKVAGEGGMGVVFVAEHLVLKQRVAVKVLLPEAVVSELVVERFAREAQSAARVSSEHIARVMDAGSTSTGAPFLVMEYLEGCDLQELLEVEGPLPVSEVVDYMLQALEALAHAHAVGIVHRDLKPANLYLACRPDGGTIMKVLDFGISKATSVNPEEKVLTGHAVLGSPVYMSPEQLRNARDIDGRADLWSLGVVAYELMTGKPPFDGDGVGEIFAAILENDAEPLYVKDARFPRAFSDVIAKCLRRKREDRWADAAELSRALKPFGTGTYGGVVERAEQVLSRAKRRESAHSMPSIEAGSGDRISVRDLDGMRPSTPQDGPPLQEADSLFEATEREHFVARARRFFVEGPNSRRVVAGGVVAVALLMIGSAIVIPQERFKSSVGDGRNAVTSATSTAGATNVANAPAAPSTPPAEAPPPSSVAYDEAPIVMDQPDTPAHTGTAPRSRDTKHGKPQRPKFLNTRE